MDSITHLTQKILAERARQGLHQRHDPIPETAPPPYTASEDDLSSDSSDSDDSEDEEDTTPVKLTINAANSIHGNNNLIPTSSSPLSDATKFSALLLHAVNRINASAMPVEHRRRRVNVDLTINCGVTVVGDRNVVGNVGLKPKSPERAIAGSAALSSPKTDERAVVVAGAKRKAESVSARLATRHCEVPTIRTNLADMSPTDLGR